MKSFIAKLVKRHFFFFFFFSPFFFFKARAPSYDTKYCLLNDTVKLIIYQGIFLKLWSKVSQIFLLFSVYVNSFKCKYLRLTKIYITRFAIKLFIHFHFHYLVSVQYVRSCIVSWSIRFVKIHYCMSILLMKMGINSSIQLCTQVIGLYTTALDGHVPNTFVAPAWFINLWAVASKCHN